MSWDFFILTLNSFVHSGNKTIFHFLITFNKHENTNTKYFINNWQLLKSSK